MSLLTNAAGGVAALRLDDDRLDIGLGLSMLLIRRIKVF